MTTTIAEAAAELTAALAAAHACIAHPDTDTPAMITGSHTGTGSRPPWNTPAADAALTAHQAIRHLEATLTLEITGRPARTRGGSDANTWRAIHQITSLAATIPTHAADTIARQLHHLATPAKRLPAIDEATRWIPIRLTTGAPHPPLCPACDHPSLRLADRAYIVMCFYPHCPGLAGERAFARLDMNRLTGEPMLIWNDEAG